MIFNPGHRALALVVVLACALTGCQATSSPPSTASPPSSLPKARESYVALPGGTNALQFRLYTNAAPNAERFFNTFELDAYGERLFGGRGASTTQRLANAAATNAAFHQILIDGRGPVLGPAHDMLMLEQASGPEWSYVALDGTAAYADRLEHYQRAILFVEPDLFILYDQLVAKAPVSFQMLLHPPATTRIDDVWHDLRLELTNVSFQLQAPGTKGMLRSWERVASPMDALLPGTATMELGPTNKVTRLDLITVLAVRRGATKTDYAFKLLESNTAVGARVHRDGLPTLIAFRTVPSSTPATLTGFGFNGPVGVDVFRPKRK